MDKKTILQQYMLSYTGKGECNKQEKTVAPSTAVQEVIPDEGYTCLSKVTVEAVTSAIDSNITAENIKKDVSILGVTGTLESGGGEDLLNALIGRSITSINSNVTSIGKYAFSYCTSLISASFQNAINILNGAFADCYKLTSVSFPNSLTSIGNDAFRECTKLTNITTLDGVTSMGDYAFSGCKNLTDISLQNVTSIGNYAFSQCNKLANITIPNVTSIGSDVFRNCYALKNILLPKVESIGGYAFYNCGIKTLSLPNAKSIGSSAFWGCGSLTDISLPNVTSIGNYAFSECSNLSLVDFRNATAVPTLSNTNAFSSTPSTKKIVVPDNLYDSWIAATNWSSTTNNIVSSIIKASDYEASL